MKPNPMRTGAAALAILLLPAIAGCDRGTGDDAGSTAVAGTIRLADPGPPVEVVNGENVPQRLLDALARSRGWDLSKPQLRERALKELTNYVLVAQAARKENLAGDIDLDALAEVSRLQAVYTAAIAAFEENSAIDDDALHAEYEKQVARIGPEYGITQIVFASEADAAKVAAEVASGKPFDKVFEAHKKKAVQMRTLAHVRTRQLPQPLADALAGMKAGETSRAPVKTPMGWHVVHVDTVSPHAGPQFENVKESLRRSLAKRASDERMGKLRAEAKITRANEGSAASGEAGGKAAQTRPAQSAADATAKPQS
jgi:peptidyl-prolyl cis-trans isomerase C